MKVFKMAVHGAIRLLIETHIMKYQYPAITVSVILSAYLGLPKYIK